MKIIILLVFVALQALFEQFAFAAGQDKFIDSIEAELGTSNSRGQVTRPVKPAAPGQESAHDPYVDAIMEEANDLSVTAVNAPKGKEIIRNQPGSKPPVTGTLVRNGRKISNGYIIVRRGDTLSQIAKDIYGNSTDYDRIYRVNRRLLRNPHSVIAGQRLRIPLP